MWMFLNHYALSPDFSVSVFSVQAHLPRCTQLYFCADTRVQTQHACVRGFHCLYARSFFSWITHGPTHVFCFTALCSFCSVSHSGKRTSLQQCALAPLVTSWRQHLLASTGPFHGRTGSSPKSCVLDIATALACCKRQLLFVPAAKAWFSRFRPSHQQLLRLFAFSSSRLQPLRLIRSAFLYLWPHRTAPRARDCISWWLFEPPKYKIDVERYNFRLWGRPW